MACNFQWEKSFISVWIQFRIRALITDTEPYMQIILDPDRQNWTV